MNEIAAGIYDLLSHVTIDTKEHGRSRVTPWPSQSMVIDMIADGLENDVHDFVILKCRQAAITTACSVIELFWALANPGVQGGIVVDRTDNLERLRRIFANLLQSLPAEWKLPEHRLVANNRNGMAFANGSVIDLLAAGNNPDLGASRALNLVHCSECAQWRSLAGVESLKASLARQNPNRLYVWESIANGFNWWYQYCQQAKQDRHMRFLFLGFWSVPTYTIEREDPDYRIYWDGHLTDDEIKRARYVRQHYNYTITPGQIAWWRREAEFKAEEYLMRHYPWTERECFIASGSGFFPAARTLELSESLARPPPYKGYKYIFDERFLSSKIEQTTDVDEVTLRVWEPPVNDGVYAIGVDPSGGGGGDANDHAIEVMRCYADRLVQVAEFQSNRPFTYQLAWVMCHLCGAYKNHTCNLEVTGIGAAVLAEVRNLRQLAERNILQAEPGSNKILDMIGNVRWFLYKRPDTMTGAGSVINWKTNADNKHQIYSELRDSLMLPYLEIRSVRLVQQMQAIVESDGMIMAGEDTGENDDLVTAYVLGHHAWVDPWVGIRMGLVARNLTWESVNDAPPKDNQLLMSHIASMHWKKINQKAQRRPENF